MARPQLNKAVDSAVSDLETVVKSMRELGVASWSNSPIGDIVLGMKPPPRQAKVDTDPKAIRRAYYTELFGRPVTDGEADHLP